MQETQVRSLDGEDSPGGGHALLSGKFHRQRSLVGYSPWGCKESDTTEQLTHTHTHTHTRCLPSGQPGLGHLTFFLTALQALWVLEILHQTWTQPEFTTAGWGLPRAVRRWQSLVILSLGLPRAAKQLGFSSWLWCPPTGFRT